MTDRELFIQTVTSEIPTFERVIKAIPAGNRDWRPDPKSKTAIELAATIAAEAESFPEFLTKEAYDFGNMQKPLAKEPDEIAVLTTQALTKAKEAANAVTDEKWADEIKTLMNGKETGWNGPRGGMVFTLFLDLIHHRGQLSTYLRAMGGKVPSIYGPSADDPGGM
jgi:uncharacterized damage-inducible protein DinB